MNDNRTTVRVLTAAAVTAMVVAPLTAGVAAAGERRSTAGTYQSREACESAISAFRMRVGGKYYCVSNENPAQKVEPTFTAYYVEYD